MLWCDVIELMSVIESENDIGDTVEEPVSVQVYANKKSIRQSEFYQSMANGLRPELMFEIRQIEYSDQDKLKYNNKTYSIIRTYSKNDEILELICQGLVNNAST